MSRGIQLPHINLVQLSTELLHLAVLTASVDLIILDSNRVNGSLGKGNETGTHYKVLQLELEAVEASAINSRIVF